MSAIDDLYKDIDFRDKEAIESMAHKLISFKKLNEICEQIDIKIITLSETESLDARETVIKEIETLIAQAKKINIS